MHVHPIIMKTLFKVSMVEILVLPLLLFINIYGSLPNILVPAPLLYSLRCAVLSCALNRWNVRKNKK